MTTEAIDQTDPSAAILPPGKDEMNFAEFPIALLTDRVPKGQKSIEFADEIYDERRKRVIPRRRIIEGSEKYGLPTATDDAVVLALIQLTKQKSNFTQRQVEFTRLELIKLLGWTNEGKNYDRIKLSLLRIANVTYNYDNAWWDGRLKTWTTKAFHIIDEVQINDSRASGGQAGLFPSSITWGNIVFESFQSGFLRNIDFHLCMRLEHAIAMRMYRFMGKRFHVRPEWVFDLKEFAYDHLGLGRNYEGGAQIARKLQPAIEELEGVGFLEAMTEAERFNKKGREWTIRLVQKVAALPSPVTAHSEAVAIDPMVQELTKLGVGESVATAMVKKHPADYLTAKIEVYEWLVAKGDNKVQKSPVGFLVKSILEDYAVPKGFTSKAEREQREASRTAKARQAAEDRRRQQQAEAADKKKRQEEAAYWQSLTADQQAELDAASIAHTDADDLAQEKGPLKETFRKLRRDRYIRQLLDNAKADA